MGKREHPRASRYAFHKYRDVLWCSQNNYGEYFVQDYHIRKCINSLIDNSVIGSISIQRSYKKVLIILTTNKPGVIIGKEGKLVELLKEKITKIASGAQVEINIQEVRNTALNAQLVAQEVGASLLRGDYRRVTKKCLKTTRQAGALGIKVRVSGRINGVSIARVQNFIDGRVPLNTIRSSISYCCLHVKAKYGILGVKVYIYLGINKRED